MKKVDKIVECLSKRFATKIFDVNFCIEKNIEKNIEKIFNLAPTSFGLQPFKLVKIYNEKDKKNIKTIAWGQEQVIDCSLLYILAVETDIDAVLKRYEKLQINFRGIEKKKAEEYSEFVKNFLNQKKFDTTFYEAWATRQAYLALGFFISVAAILDIDTAPLEGFDNKELDEILGLSKIGLSSRILLCIGKRDTSDEYPKLPKLRKANNDLVVNFR